MEKSELHFFDKQTIRVEDFQAEGWILDICGGGEGVIAQLKGEQVVAIDKNMRELVEAPSGGLKIQMDATNLQFTDESFNTATAFFGLMFIPMKDHAQVFKEVYRVMRPGGKFYIWDIEIREQNNTEKKGFAFYLDVQLSDHMISTGYGYRWPEKQQDCEYFAHVLKQIGFRIISSERNGLVFTMFAAKE